MGELINRKRYTASIDKKTIEKLKEYSKESMIPISKIMDNAINEYIDKKTRK